MIIIIILLLSIILIIIIIIIIIVRVVLRVDSDVKQLSVRLNQSELVSVTGPACLSLSLSPPLSLYTSLYHSV